MKLIISSFGSRICLIAAKNLQRKPVVSPANPICQQAQGIKTGAGFAKDSGSRADLGNSSYCYVSEKNKRHTYCQENTKRV